MAKQSRATITALSVFSAIKELCITVISGLNSDASSFDFPIALNISKAEDSASADGDSGIPILATRKATPADTSGTDGDYEFLQIKDGRLWTRSLSDGLSQTFSQGVTGARFTSADQSGAVAAVSDAPTSTQKLVVTEIIVSADADMRLDFSIETAGTLLASVWLLAKTTQVLRFTKLKLATADKKLMVRTSAAGNVYVTPNYYSEA